MNLVNLIFNLNLVILTVTDINIENSIALEYPTFNRIYLSEMWSSISDDMIFFLINTAPDSMFEQKGDLYAYDLIENQLSVIEKNIWTRLLILSYNLPILVYITPWYDVERENPESKPKYVILYNYATNTRDTIIYDNHMGNYFIDQQNNLLAIGKSITSIKRGWDFTYYLLENGQLLNSDTLITRASGLNCPWDGNKFLSRLTISNSESGAVSWIISITDIRDTSLTKINLWENSARWDLFNKSIVNSACFDSLGKLKCTTGPAVLLYWCTRTGLELYEEFNILQDNGDTLDTRGTWMVHPSITTPNYYTWAKLVDFTVYLGHIDLSEYPLIVDKLAGEAIAINVSYLNSSIRFQVSSCVNGSRIGIYDIHGGLVKTIKVKDQSSIPWHGTDNNGNQLPSGIYFARAEDEQGNVATTNVVLVR
jgi:hypothetical protein